MDFFVDNKVCYISLKGFLLTVVELKDYMNFQENMPGRTSVIFFSDKLSKLQKQETKIKKRLVEKEGKVVRYLGDKFKFVKP